MRVLTFDEQGATDTQTETELTTLTEYETQLIQGVDNLVNISLFNGFFLGCILGALVVGLFWKRINP